MLEITCRSFGIKQCEASFDLKSQGRLEVGVEYQTDRYHRVYAVWVPTEGVEIPVLKGFETYLDSRAREVVSAEHIARTTSSRMFAHTLNGADWRKLVEAGVIAT